MIDFEEGTVEAWFAGNKETPSWDLISVFTVPAGFEPLVTLEEAAQYVSPTGAITEGMLRKWGKKGMLTTYRPANKDVFVTLKDVKELLQKSRNAPRTGKVGGKNACGQFMSEEE